MQYVIILSIIFVDIILDIDIATSTADWSSISSKKSRSSPRRERTTKKGIKCNSCICMGKRLWVGSKTSTCYLIFYCFPLY